MRADFERPSVRVCVPADQKGENNHSLRALDVLSRRQGFSAVAGSIGRALAARGMLLLLVEADAPIPGVPGRLYPGHNPLYLRGPFTPHVGDLAYTEIALFEPGYY